MARALSLVEDGFWQAETIWLLKELYPHTGEAFIIGVTGSPGSGKSTLVDQLIVHYRKEGAKVGVIAVDPTSPFSGGAVLGDRIRMQSVAGDDGVFIRSMATRGKLGGLSPSIHEALLVLDAAGFEILIVETVGVGQDEVDIVKAADCSLVLLVPGMGDDVQTIKAGIMEIGDVFVINKADREGVQRTENEIKALLSIAIRNDSWSPSVIRTVATRGEGLQDLLAAISSYRAHLQSSESRGQRRLQISRERLTEMLRERLASIIQQKISDEVLDRYAERMMNRELDPYTIVENLLKVVGRGGHKA